MVSESNSSKHYRSRNYDFSYLDLEWGTPSYCCQLSAYQPPFWPKFERTLLSGFCSGRTPRAYSATSSLIFVRSIVRHSNFSGESKKIIRGYNKRQTGQCFLTSRKYSTKSGTRACYASSFMLALSSLLPSISKINASSAAWVTVNHSKKNISKSD